MAKLLKPGSASMGISPNGKSFTLEELYNLLECKTVERVLLPDGSYMWLDEEAKIKRNKPPLNSEATRLLHMAGGQLEDYVLGNALVANALESGDEDD